MHFFGSKNGSFSAFWHYKNKEGLSSRGLDVNWHIPSTCLDASRKRFSTGIYSMKRASGGYGQKMKKPLKIAKMCAASRLERQFATLYLFHAPTGICVRAPVEPSVPLTGPSVPTTGPSAPLIGLFLFLIDNIEELGLWLSGFWDVYKNLAPGLA